MAHAKDDAKAEKPSDEKSKSRGFWNMLFSAADPELQNLASRLHRLIPEDSVLHSKVARRIIGMLKGWIETQAEGMPPVVGAIVEKLTDVADFSTHSDGEHAAAAKVATDAWITQLFASSGERLKKAADPHAEAEKINQEFTARLKLLETMEAAMKKYEEDKRAANPKPAAFAAEPHHIREEVDSFFASWKRSLERRGANTERKKS